MSKVTLILCVILIMCNMSNVAFLSIAKETKREHVYGATEKHRILRGEF